MLLSKIHRIQLEDDDKPLRESISLSSATDEKTKAHVDRLSADHLSTQFFRIITKELKKCTSEDTLNRWRRSTRIIVITEEANTTLLTPIFNSKSEQSYDEFDFLLVLQQEEDASEDRDIFPEYQLTLSNGEKFNLLCIIAYKSNDYSIIHSGIRNTINYSKLPLSSKVLTKYKHIIVYEKVSTHDNSLVCPTSGCPFDLPFPTGKLLVEHMLVEHMLIEHPTCSYCGEVFLMRILFNEHLQDCRDAVKESHDDKTDDDFNDMKSTVEEPKRKKIFGNRKKPSKDLGNEQLSTVEEPKRKKMFGNRKNNSKDLGDGQAFKRHLHFPNDLNLNSSKRKHQQDSKRFCKNTQSVHKKCRLVTNGVIHRNESLIRGIPKFVPFCNAFLRIQDCQFYFKDLGRTIKILSYSGKNESLTYKLTISDKHCKMKFKSSIGKRINVDSKDFDSEVLDYKLSLYLSI